MLKFSLLYPFLKRMNVLSNHLHISQRYKFISFSCFLLMVFLYLQTAMAVDTVSYISFKKEKRCFTLSSAGASAPLVVSSRDHAGVLRVVKYLQTDIGRVTGIEPELAIDAMPASKQVVIIGTLTSPLIEKLVQSGKIHVEDINGRWEKFLIQVVDKPLPGIDRALVITGSDKRGTLYGILDLSAHIGVSPWHWWADVPVRYQTALYIKSGRYTFGEPAVKYRGIFINDEEPALGRWVVENYGGFNHLFYEKVFELLLRLKANYLWPAMWWAGFNSDDPLNPQLADEMGIVMGTTHHEPMMRAHAEWRQPGHGAWNYETNAAELCTFWTEGIQRMDSHESIVTLAMRGDGDMAMSESTNIALLEKIVNDQRKIIAEVTGRDVKTIPQIWALYKEVQDYYDKGMRVPDDVTLLLCDDNWGNLRKLPGPGEQSRSGGYGIYYHFDYVGGPRNYKWLNTNPLPRVWEQMHLAYRHGVDRLWIVNVGDIKPMELPIEFFLDYAWDPDQWPAESLPEYTRLWAEQQFGKENAFAIAGLLTTYTKFNGRRKPELLAPDTYSLVHYREAETIVADYNRLAGRAESIEPTLPSEFRDAFYQLVLYPVKACANLNELYLTVGKNHLYAKQRRAAANSLAQKARELFTQDAELANYYNHIMAAGKWNHMMDQTHIGYTYWQQPDKDIMPAVEEIELPAVAEMAVAVEGSESWWPAEPSPAILPPLDVYQQQSRYFEVFNRGLIPFEYSVQSEAPWLLVTPQQGTVQEEQRIWVKADWAHVPVGDHQVPVTVSGPDGTSIVVQVVVHNPGYPKPGQVKGFVEGDGYVSMEAEHYSKAVGTPQIHWQRIPDLGRTLSAMTPFPVTATCHTPAGNSPRLEYRVFLFHSGEVTVRVFLSPTLNFYNNQGLRYAISFNDELPQVVNIHAGDTFQVWEESVRNNIKVLVSKHILDKPGEHVLKFWMMDPGVVLQKLVIETGQVPASYLGPPESYYRK
jgi:hypothetical protein